MIGRQRHSRHFNCPSRHMQVTQRAPPRRGRRDSRSRNRTLLHNIAGALGRPGSSFLLNKPHTGPRARTTHQGHSRSATSPWRLGLTPCYRCAMPWAPLRPAAGQGGGCEKKGRWVSEGWEFGFKRLSSLSLPVCYFSLPGLLWLCAFLPLRSELCRIFKLRRLFHPGVLILTPRRSFLRSVDYLPTTPTARRALPCRLVASDGKTTPLRLTELWTQPKIKTENSAQTTSRLAGHGWISAIPHAQRAELPAAAPGGEMQSSHPDHVAWRPHR